MKISKAFCGVLIAMALAGCAEKNFVPGSPMAKLAGYNRPYEEIAADDCSAKFGFSRGTDMHTRCVYELSMTRRQRDDARAQNNQNLMTLGAGILATQPRPPTAAPAEEHVCIASNNVLYRC